MELVDGKSLDQLLPSAGFELDRFFPLTIQIADALAAAEVLDHMSMMVVVARIAMLAGRSLVATLVPFG